MGGFNVTIPHKETIMAFLDEVTDEARAIGAVNTVHLEEGRAIGYNTDGAGFLLPLKKVGTPRRPARRLHSGSGRRGRGPWLRHCWEPAAGAWQSPIVPSRGRNAWQQNYNQDTRTRRLRQSACPTPPTLPRQSRLVVNSTSVGMHRGDDSPLPAGCLGPQHVVYDIVYRPLVTLFLKDARAAGATTIGGLDMLIGQGAAAFTIWTGLPFPLEAVRPALEARLD